MTGYKDYGFPDDKPSHTFNYLHEPLLSLLNKDKNKCVLDLGCGNGHLVKYLLSQGYNAYGTDASEKGITIARETDPERFFLQDLSTGTLPPELKDIPFDTIISTEVIEHLYDPALFVNFCRKALANEKGEIVITTPYHGYLKNFMMGVFNKWDKHLDPLWEGGHIKFWSKASLSKILTNAGFTVVAFKGCGRVPYFWKSMMIKGVIA
jgi:2-polyprenyl-3-methyl-5-hydroxy-6-metoxy-1,4-benzoquinol methylase